MNNITKFSFVIAFFSFTLVITAQDLANNLKQVSGKYKKHNPFYDVSEELLNDTDTIPDFNTKPDKLKISGTIFESDGKTPAKDVVLFIYQPDEDGNYEVKKDDNRNRNIYHRAWIKTDANGHYTFYTFMPGKFERSRELKQIHRTIKVPGQPEQQISSFFFDDDPLIPYLTLSCRAKAVQSMLRLEKEGDMYVTTKDIRLNKDLFVVYNQ